MAKDKLQKKKDREKRVAQKKLMETQKRTAEQKKADTTEQSAKSNVFTPSMNLNQPKTKPAAAGKRPMIHRRSSGGG